MLKKFKIGDILKFKQEYDSFHILVVSESDDHFNPIVGLVLYKNKIFPVLTKSVFSEYFFEKV